MRDNRDLLEQLFSYSTTENSLRLSVLMNSTISSSLTLFFLCGSLASTTFPIHLLSSTLDTVDTTNFGDLLTPTPSSDKDWFCC